MYQIWLINFQYYYDKTFDNIIDAIKLSKETGFETCIHYILDDKIVEVI